jgi:hypothetical protein
MAQAVKKLHFHLPGFGRVHAMEGGELNIGGVERTAKKSVEGVIGPTEEPAVPSVSFKIAKTRGVSLHALGDLNNVNITVIDDTGDSWVLISAWTATPPKMTNGDIDMKMEALRCDQVS